MKKISVVLFVFIFIAAAVSSVYAYEAHYGPTELIQYDSSKAYNGYTLFTPFRQPPGEPVWTYLIDMEGFVVHSFSSPHAPGLHAMLEETGNFLRGARPAGSGGQDEDGLVSYGGAGGLIQALTWNGDVIFEFPWDTMWERQHHDFHRIYNDALGEETFIFLEWQRKGPADAVNLGVDATGTFADPGWTDGWAPDGIVEVSQAGEVIWRWTFSDHVVTTDPSGTALGAPWLDESGEKLNYPAEVVADTSLVPDRMDINAVFVNNVHDSGPEPDWNHCNSLDYNEELNHIVLNAKHNNEFYVVDHGGTFVAGDPAQSIANAGGPAGDFVYRFGQPSNYGQGVFPGHMDQGDTQFWACHDIQWIDDYHWRPDLTGQDRWPDPTSAVALPGGGNFLIFDNSTWNALSSHSASVEINQFIDDTLADTGDYVWPHLAGYTVLRNNQDLPSGETAMLPRGVGSWNFNNQVQWRYTTRNPNSFYARYISGNQRLPNGNTVIMSGPKGHMFEVTMDGEVVWEYINPITTTGAETSQNSSNSDAFAVFRCHRYGPDFPGLAGKNLQPRSTLTGRMPLSGGAEDYDTVPAYTGFGFSGLGIGGGGAAGGGAGGGAGGH
jgi:hypothetical protein